MAQNSQSSRMTKSTAAQRALASMSSFGIGAPLAGPISHKIAAPIYNVLKRRLGARAYILATQLEPYEEELLTYMCGPEPPIELLLRIMRSYTQTESPATYNIYMILCGLHAHLRTMQELDARLQCTIIYEDLI